MKSGSSMTTASAAAIFLAFSSGSSVFSAPSREGGLPAGARIRRATASALSSEATFVSSPVISLSGFEAARKAVTCSRNGASSSVCAALRSLIVASRAATQGWVSSAPANSASTGLADGLAILLAQRLAVPGLLVLERLLDPLGDAGLEHGDAWGEPVDVGLELGEFLLEVGLVLGRQVGPGQIGANIDDVPPARTAAPWHPS